MRVFSVGQFQGRNPQGAIRFLGNLSEREIRYENDEPEPTEADLEAIAEEEERIINAQPILLSGGRRRK